MNKLLFSFFVLSFFAVGQAIAFPDDFELNDVEEFDYNGLQVILRESKDVPSVTAVLYIKGGSR